MLLPQSFSKLGKVFFTSALPLIITTLPTAAKAAQKFDALYVFGDSLSDTGNVFETSGDQFPPSPYFEGRFSNGPNWIDYLGEDLGLSPSLVTGSASSTEGINFAFGGATTGSDNTIALTSSVFAGLPSLQQEISYFTGRVPTADPDALYIVWAGANDYLPTQGSFVPSTSPDVPLENLSNAVTSLANVGAKNIMVVNLPDLGITPVATSVDQSLPGTSAALCAVSEAHNAGLKTTLNDLSQNLDINIIPLYVDSLFEKISDNPGEFGLTNVTDSCLNISNGTVCSDQKEHLFWDSYHPTTAVHQILAEQAFSVLESQAVPEPAAEWGVLAPGVLGMGGLLRQKQKKANKVKL